MAPVTEWLVCTAAASTECDAWQFGQHVPAGVRDLKLAAQEERSIGPHFDSRGGFNVLWFHPLARKVGEGTRRTGANGACNIFWIAGGHLDPRLASSIKDGWAATQTVARMDA